VTAKTEVQATEEFLGIPRDRLSTFWATCMGWGLDGADYQMYSLVLPGIVAAFSLSTAQAGAIGTTTLVVSAVGGAFAGTVADRIGRVRTLALAVATFAVFTFLSGTATSYPELLVFRALEGLGFGGEWAVGAVLIAETVAARRRGVVLGLVQGSWAIGWGLALAVSLVVLPNLGGLGWRVMFFIGLLPAALTFYILRKVREPEIWKGSRRRSATPAVSFFHIFHPRLLRITIPAALLAVGVQSGYYAIFTWLPSFLEKDRHLSVVGSSGYLGLVIIGSFAGYVLSGFANDALGRKLTFLIYSVFSAVIVVVYTHIQVSPSTLLGLSFPLGFFASGIFSGFGPLYAELFPTEVRAFGEGFAYNFGRGVAGVAPLVIGMLAATYGLATGIAIFAPAAYAVGIVALAFLPETRGRRLESFASSPQ
jgi:MFS family permease